MHSARRASPYSVVEHLASAIWLNHDPRRRLLVAFTAYFDASGHPDNAPTLFVSGLVASVEKWLRFEDEWNCLLVRYNITPPFHMKEFAPGTKQYRSWLGDLARRQRFLTEAIGLIKRRTQKSFSSGVLLNELRKARETYVTPENWRYPFVLCGTMVIVRVAEWMYRQGIHAKDIAFVFEDGDKHKGRLLDALDKKEFKATIAFRPKTDCPPLQAADLIAWEHNRLVTNATVRGVRKLRGSLRALVRQIPHDNSWGLHDRKSILAHCKRFGFPVRSLSKGAT